MPTKRDLWDRVIHQERQKIEAVKRVRELEVELAREKARADQAEAVIDSLVPPQRPFDLDGRLVV